MSRLQPRYNAQSRHRDEGFTSVWVLGLSALVLVLGLAVFDIWRVYGTQRALTARADAAAAAGAQAINERSFETDGTLQLLAGDPEDAGSAANLAKARIEADLRGDLGADASISVNAIPAGATCEGDPVRANEAIACVAVDNSVPNRPTVTVTIRRKPHFQFFTYFNVEDRVVAASGTAGPR